jgi:GNAT superfamily N-acetyltransferase
LGKALLEAAFETYRSMGCHKVKLTANTPMAKRFYLKHGMVVEGKLKNHWWNLDFIILAKILS